MGCTSSSQQGGSQPVPEKYAAEGSQPDLKTNENVPVDSPTVSTPDKPKPVSTTPSPSTSNKFTAFKGLKVGTLVLCKDEFVSKYTGERMCRWRRSEIRAIELEDRSRVLIHYCEWSDNFDFYLDLHTQYTKLAPIDLLSKNQCDLGLTLDDDQLRITFHYVVSGKLHKRNAPPLIDTTYINGIGNNTHSPPKTSETAESESANGAAHKTPGSAAKSRPISARIGGFIDGSNHGAGSVDGSSVNGSVNGSKRDSKELKAPHPTSNTPTYTVDEQLDIQDIFCKKGTNTPTYKWRKAKVVKVMEDRQSIRIHYLNWDSKFDETLHVIKAAHRISPANTMTSTPELSRQQNKIAFSAPAVAGGIAFGNGKKFVEESHATHPPPSPVTTAGKATTPKTGTAAATAAAAAATNGSKKKKKTHNYLKWFNVRRTVFEGGDGEEDFDCEDDENDFEQAQAASLSQLEAEEAEAVAEAEAYERSQAQQQHHEGEDEMTEEEIAEEEKKIVAIERLFLSHMDKMGLHVVVSEGDGNCLFRSVSHQLYMTEDYHEELRAKCVQHQIQHKERFEMFCSTNFDEHIKEMSQLGCWGDDLEIRALEEITDRIICIYSSDCAHSYYHDKSIGELDEIWRRQSHMNGKHKLDDIVSAPIKQNFEEDALLKGVSPLCLSYHGQNHYNSVYNEKIALPLNMRKSRVLLKARMALFDCDVVVKPVSPNRGKGAKKASNGATSSSNGASSGSRPPTAERPTTGTSGNGSSGNTTNGSTSSGGIATNAAAGAGAAGGGGRASPSRSNSDNSREGNMLESSGSSSADHTFLDEQYRRHMQFMSSSSGNMFRK